MEKSRLLDFFRSFSEQELRDLKKFVRSPFHNTREDVVALFDFLYKNAPSFAPKKINKEAAFRAVFPGEPFQERKITYTMSYLLNVGKAFLSFQEFSATHSDQHIYLSRALRKRGLFRHIEQELKAAGEELEASPWRNAEFYLQNYHYHLEHYIFNHHQKLEDEEHFQAFSDSFITAFLTNKLRHACAAMTHKTVRNISFRQHLDQETLQLAEQPPFCDMPAVRIYFLCLKVLSGADDGAFFQELLGLLQQKKLPFPPGELREILLLAVNHCIHQFNTGNKPFLRTAFDIYIKGLEEGVFVEDGEMSHFTYRNIAMAGIGLKEFDWAEGFLTNYKGFVEKKYRDSAFYYNLATLWFRKPDHPKALELLQMANFDDPLHNLDARRMLMQIFYDTGEFDALSSLLNSIKIFIFRHRRTLGYHRENYLQLIGFVGKMLALPPGDRTAVKKLKYEVEGTAAVAERVWLLERLAAKL